jgi:glucosamine-6-phosphate deaminase
VKIKLFNSKKEMGMGAALDAASLIRSAADRDGAARIIVATGASHFDFLEALTSIGDIPWPQVTMFHLDEYIGMPEDHPASFRRYLRERFISKVGLGSVHLLHPGENPALECERVGRLIQEAPVDVAFVGIGENGHLAFNDPPADFQTEAPYVIVGLDAQCRQQQMGEGWFAALEDVPKQAISMSIRQIMKSRHILCIVPEARKANAVAACLQGPICPQLPASILRTHENTILYLDRESSSLLPKEGLS